MATITALGVGSGLDLSGLLDQLDSAERTKLEPITTQKTAQQTKLTAYGRLKSALTSLQTAAAALNKGSTFQGVTSSISGSGVTVAAKSSAVVGSYEVKVNSLARAQTLATAGVADRTADLGAGTLTLSVGSGEAMTIELTDSASSLEDVRDAINKQNGGVSASIVNAGGDTPYRLVLTSTTTGTSSEMSLSFSGSGELSSLLGYDSSTGTGVMTETVAAADASLTVNGIDITSQSNVVEGAVQGVTLSLTEAGGTHTLQVASDTEAVTTAIDTFVSAWNTLQSTVSSLTSYNSDTQVAGALLGDSTLRSIQGQLRNALTAAVGEGTVARLADVGIDLALGGKLSLDSDKLSDLLASDPAALSSFFVGDSTDGGLAGQLGSVLDGMLDSGGSLDVVTEGINTRIEALDERYTRMEESIEATIERYRKQFTQLDLLISQMDATSSYLTQQFDAMAAQLGD